MYCKHCGKEIDDNSTFCKHCGKSQGNSQIEITSKPLWIVYIIWALANLYLLMGEKYSPEYGCEYKFYFFPCIFSDSDCILNKYYYDFSEFIVYVFVLPVILFIVYKRNKEKIDDYINNILNK